MEAGRLDKQVTIQAFTVTQNGIGEAVKGWANVATVWASVEPLQGREFWSQQQLQSEVTTRVRIRYRADVTAKNRILYGTRVLLVESVINPKERKEELQLMCSEGVSND